jgi:thiosulfate dehydrogenase
MRRFCSSTVIALTVCLYLLTILAGLCLKTFPWSPFRARAMAKSAWQPPPSNTIPRSPRGDSIRYGALLFTETAVYAPAYAGNALSCSSCHAAGGIQPWASPMIGLPALFPMFNKRAGRVISLRDRIQECFVRSENGHPLADPGPEMQSLVDYITWLSEPQPDHRPFVGRGFIALPDLTPNPQHGAEVYAAQCAGCHGADGNGIAPQFPPLWGSRSFNDGAGMHNLAKMAAFVQQNMPQNRKGILAPQDAFDVSAFIHAQPRPAFNEAFKNF